MGGTQLILLITGIIAGLAPCRAARSQRHRQASYANTAPSTMPSISNSDLTNLVIAFPPVASQRHILAAQVETLRFCRRFLTSDPREAGANFYDPKGRQYDQMTQAARSGRQNIIEGSERASTSKDTEMKLTDVARASLSELRGDYEIFILDRQQLPWSALSPEAKAVNAVSLDPAPFTDDMVHESAKHALQQRAKYAQWLDSEDAVVVANAMLIIIGRALNMLKSQVEAQGKAFETTGGFTERLTAKRIEAREKDKGPSPDCPLCNKPMRRRKSAKGEFWGCSTFPDCKGTRPA